MKASICSLIDPRRGSAILSLLTLGACLLAGSGASSTPNAPRITSIAGSDQHLTITASVPADARTATLESRARVESGSWQPRAVQHRSPTDNTTTVQFTVPVELRAEVFRVRAEFTDPLPSSFYTGTNQFAGEPTTGSAPAPGMIRGTDFTSTASPGDASMEDGGSGAPREVAESDLWRIQNDTLYFFNQYRGLQILDVSDPDHVSVQGQLSLPAAGEQLYVLPSGLVVLLAQSGCYFSNNDQSEVLVVDPTGSTPSVVARLPVPGRIQESRLVGDALYVASQSYRQRIVYPDAGDEPEGDANNVDSGSTLVWEWGLALSSFDLARPLQPEARTTLWFGGYGNVVAATPNHFFVVTDEGNGRRQSILNSVDISDPTGLMHPLPSIRAAGRITDKFKIHVHDGILSIVSQVQSTTLYTELETFSFSQSSDRWEPLGRLSLGLSERLHATRFVEDRVYVVTFFVPLRLDPLFIVDLSDPAHPTIKGELEIPGYSTFLYPRGDQLLALGLETNRTTVSLFDVSDPAQPSLLSRLRLGDGWSWTEANHNEKAFRVLEDQNLVLLPIQTWTENGYRQEVQLIDLLADSVEARGAINHEFTPRRATWHRDRILSLSGRELLSVDATDRDHPEVVQETPLAWPVDRVFVHGDFLLELEAGSFWWSESPAPQLRVAPANRPDAVSGRLTLPQSLPVVGATLRHDRLYLVQGNHRYYPLYALAEDNREEEAANTNFILTTVDVSQLPNVSIQQTTRLTLEDTYGGTWEPVWPEENTLVWIGGGFHFWWWPLDVAYAAPESGLAADSLIAWPPYYGGRGGHLLAFQVQDDGNPEFASALNLTTNAWWNFSRPQTVNGLIYLSHQASVFVEGLDISNMTTTKDGKRGVWVQKHFLEVIDYAEPREPLRRRPVNLPGQLQGISHHGRVLYTVGYHYDPRTGTSDWLEYLDASAYDGAAVHRIDSLPLPNLWPHPVIVDSAQNDVYVGLPGNYYYNPSSTDFSHLERWTISDQGRWVREMRIELAKPVNQGRVFGNVLAIQQSDNQVWLYQTGQPDALPMLGEGRPPGCVYFQLSDADLEQETGLWLPLGVFGTAQIPLRSPQP